MAHFAKINYDGKILSVLTVSNNSIIGTTQEEEEASGIEFLNKLTGYPFWMQTSYNGTFRKNYASIGGVYDKEKDAFIAPKPYNSWSLNEETCIWEAPIAYPITSEGSGIWYTWDEETTNWIEVQEVI